MKHRTIVILFCAVSRVDSGGDTFIPQILAFLLFSILTEYNLHFMALICITYCAICLIWTGRKERCKGSAQGDWLDKLLDSVDRSKYMRGMSTWKTTHRLTSDFFLCFWVWNLTRIFPLIILWQSSWYWLHGYSRRTLLSSPTLLLRHYW